MFSALPKANFNISIASILSFANAFNSGQSEILSFGKDLTSTRHNILSKPLAAFPQNHCRNDGQPWERNESCRNDYLHYQSSERILVEPGIEPASPFYFYDKDDRDDVDAGL